MASYAEAYSERGMARSSIGDRRGALSDFRTVIETDLASLLAIMAGTIMIPAMKMGPRMVPITKALVRTRSMNSRLAMTRMSFMPAPR